MIYCVCRQINTRKVDEAAANGARRAKDVMRHNDTKFNCGSCVVAIQERLDALYLDAMQEQAPAGAGLIAAE